jgi:hypothetical protein
MRRSGEIIIARGKSTLCQMTVVIMATLIAACDSGPSEAEFVAACIKEGEKGANKALRREMGVKSDAFCKCAATEARSSLSADAQRAMIADMQGKSQEARAISSKMSDADQMALMKVGWRFSESALGGFDRGADHARCGLIGSVTAR